MSKRGWTVSGMHSNTSPPYVSSMQAKNSDTLTTSPNTSKAHGPLCMHKYPPSVHALNIIIQAMATKMRRRLPLLILLLGVVFLASVSVAYGALAYWEKENPCHHKCLQSCAKENDVKRQEACQAVCIKLRENEGGHCRPPQQQQEEEEEEDDKPRRPRGSQPGEEEEEEAWEHRVARRRRHSSSSRRARNIPFYFPRQRFQTRYRSEHGRIRVLQRFDRRSDRLENLQNYRVVEFEARPNTILLPKHSDADFILVVQQGEATVHLVDPNNRDSYNLERGQAIRIPAGTLSYLVNRDDNHTLKIVTLAVPINKPGTFQDFFPASSQDQQSYFRGFSRSTLEAAFNSRFEDIRRILLGEINEEQQRSQQEGVIVRVPKDQIKELTRHAKSSSRKGEPSKSGPFNLRSRDPIYSNQFGRFYEVTPDDRNPQLQDLDLLLSCVEIKEGGLMLPHYNSRSIVVLMVNQGKARIELVGLRDEQPPRRQHDDHDEEEEEEQEQEQGEEEEEDEEEEEEGPREVRRYSVKLSEGDVFVIPAAHPVAINASSDLHLLGFGINAENNQRNFLAGEDDNVINQINRQVKELAFPGSSQEVERLIRKQRESHFVSAQPQQQKEKEGTRENSKGPLSSILGAFN